LLEPFDAEELAADRLFAVPRRSVRRIGESLKERQLHGGSWSLHQWSPPLTLRERIRCGRPHPSSDHGIGRSSEQEADPCWMCASPYLHCPAVPRSGSLAPSLLMWAMPNRMMVPFGIVLSRRLGIARQTGNGRL